MWIKNANLTPGTVHVFARYEDFVAYMGEPASLDARDDIAVVSVNALLRPRSASLSRKRVIIKGRVSYTAFICSFTPNPVEPVARADSLVRRIN